MKQDIFVSIIPTFFCNRRCKYCYQLDKVNDSTLLALDVCEQRLQSIIQYYNIDTISLFGGELSLLDEQYLDQLFSICTKCCNTVNLNTNLTNIKLLDIAKRHNVGCAASYNHDRADYKYVHNTIKSLPPRKLSIDTVLTSYYIDYDFEKLLDEYEQLDIVSVMFLPYSGSVANHCYTVTNKQLTNMLIKIYQAYQRKQYSFTIANFEIDYRRCSIDSNVFILPNSQFSSIQYDDNGHEYFYQYDIIEQLQQLMIKESLQFVDCLTCQYYNTLCFAEHLKYHNQDDECCGCKRAIPIIYER